MTRGRADWRVWLAVVMITVGVLSFWQFAVALASRPHPILLFLGMLTFVVAWGPGLVVAAAWLSGIRTGQPLRLTWRVAAAAALFVVGVYFISDSVSRGAWRMGPEETHGPPFDQLAYDASQVGSALIVGGAWLLRSARSHIRRRA